LLFIISIFCFRLATEEGKEGEEEDIDATEEDVFEVLFVMREDELERFEISLEASLMTERVFVSKILSFWIFIISVCCPFTSDRISSILLLSSSSRRWILRISFLGATAMLGLEAAKASAAWRITSILPLYDPPPFANAF
jgi:hypothetical protein